MSGAEETFLDPDKAARGASQLTQAGADLATRFQQLSGTIARLNGAKPWGTDEAGEKFNEQYLAGGDDAPGNVMLSSGKQVVDRVHQLGPDVHSAVEGTVDTDDLVAKWFDAP